MFLVRPNVLVSKIIMNCNSVSFQCIVSLKSPFKMQTLRSLMLWPSALLYRCKTVVSVNL